MMTKMRANSDKRYTIGQLSKILSIPITTLRYYDEKGLLVPQKRDESSNYRYYAESQIFDALNLIQLKHLGMPLLEIKELLSTHGLAEIRANLEARMQQCQDVISRMQMQYSTTLNVYNQLGLGLALLDTEEEQSQKSKFHITYVPLIDIVAQTADTTHFQLESFIQACTALISLCGRKELHINGPFHMVFVNHTAERFVTGTYVSRVFFPIGPSPVKHTAIQQFGGFWTISTLHVGSYETLTPCYQELIDEAQRRGLTINGDPFEEYLLHHHYIDDEENFITRVSFPIQKPSPAELEKANTEKLSMKSSNRFHTN